MWAVEFTHLQSLFLLDPDIDGRDDPPSSLPPVRRRRALALSFRSEDRELIFFLRCSPLVHHSPTGATFSRTFLPLLREARARTLSQAAKHSFLFFSFVARPPAPSLTYLFHRLLRELSVRIVRRPVSARVAHGTGLGV